MPITPFGKWTPSLIEYESPENVSDVDNMFPCVKGYAPWFSYQTARPALLYSANNGVCIYGSASPQLAMVSLGSDFIVSNVQTASSAWFTLNPNAAITLVTFTNSGGAHIMRCSSTVNLTDFHNSNKAFFWNAGLNNGTLTVMHGDAAFSNHGARTATANFVDRIYFSRTVASAETSWVGCKCMFDTDDTGWSIAQFRAYMLIANRSCFPFASSPLSLGDGAQTTTTYTKRLLSMDTSFKAGVVGVINEFAVCGDLVEADSETRNKIWWSAIGCPFDWQVDSATQCGNATLPGGSGEVRGIVSGEYGLILCANEIYRMLYVGLPTIFDITIGFRNMGVLGKHAWASYRDMLFMATNNGFKMILDGSVVHDIGKEDGIDDFFQQDLDTAYVNSLHCAVDGLSTRVFWSYRSQRAGVTDHDRLLCFDWKLQKWSKRTCTGAGLIPHIIYADVLDASRSRIGVIDNTNDVVWAQTPTAITSEEDYVIESGEYEYNQGGRVLVQGLRPVYEQMTATPSVAVYHRESMGQVASSTAAGSANAYGQFPVHVAARYTKFRINFGNKNFRRVAGFQVAVTNEGEQ